jgi:hypothetical protein
VDPRGRHGLQLLEISLLSGSNQPKDTDFWLQVLELNSPTDTSNQFLIIYISENMACLFQNFSRI